ncbi:MAG: hypothetical protein ACJ763_08585 [Bdellovibrionia bacterium]
MRSIPHVTFILALFSSLCLLSCESSQSPSAPSTALNQQPVFRTCTYTDQETYQLSTSLDLNSAFQDHNVPVGMQILTSTCSGDEPGAIHYEYQSILSRSGNALEFQGDQVDVKLSLNGSSINAATITGCSSGLEIRQTVNFGALDAQSHQIWLNVTTQITESGCVDRPLQ